MSRRDGLSSPPRTPNQSADETGMTQNLSPIYREFEVSCSVEHAFDTWTRRIGLWWPLAGHSVSHEDAASVRIEPVLGGRIIETTRTGKEIVWGTVNQWQPPSKFGYFWHIGEDTVALWIDYRPADGDYILVSKAAMIRGYEFIDPPPQHHWWDRWRARVGW